MSVDHGSVPKLDTSKTVSSIRKNPITTKSLKCLFADKDETGDVCFIVESERIRAHRCVLAAISSKYKTQFYGSQPDMGDVKVTGSTASAFRKFIELFYLDEIELTTDDIEGVLDLAHQSLVNDFVELCEYFLCEITPAGNLFLGYRLAILYEIEELKDLCELLITKDTMNVFKSEDFIDNCDRNSLLGILKLDTLNCTETEAFDACIEWSKAACLRRNVDPKKAENLRFELDEVITQIRFGSMTIENFVVRQKNYGGIFSQDETNEIFYLIGQLKGFKSEKFNQTPRNLSKKQSKLAACLECSRVLSYKADNRFAEYVMGSILSFTCNRSIRLEGFVVGCSDYDSLYVLLVTMNGSSIHIQIKTSSNVNKERNETTITFDEPIDVDANVLIQILFDIKNLKMSTKYELASKVSADNLKFVFPFVNEDNYVTKLLYNLR